MVNQAAAPVIHRGWIPFFAEQSSTFPEQNTHALEETDFLDEVPVMPATVLGLDMLLQEPCIDLQMVSELVLNDVGATIQILRLIGKEYEIPEERPYRIVDCIASLDVDALYGVISARTLADAQEHSAMLAAWKHCRLVAQNARLVAESLDGISPEDAYLVGLLHEVGRLPEVLGLSSHGWEDKDQNALSAWEGMLPPFVLAALRCMNDPSPSVWRFILTTAHKLADIRTD